jgi:hypothetical protein
MTMTVADLKLLLQNARDSDLVVVDVEEMSDAGIYGVKKLTYQPSESQVTLGIIEYPEENPEESDGD